VYSLGNFSAYSFYGATWTVEQLVKAAKAAGYKGVGLSDMGSFYGAVEFSQACDRENMRMVLACRVRIRDFVPGWLQVTVRDQVGYRATCRLLSGLHSGEAEWSALEELQKEAEDHVWISCPIRVEHSYGGRIGAYPRWRGEWEKLLRRDWSNLWLELSWNSASERLLQRRVFSEWKRRGWDRWVIMGAFRHDASARGGELLELLQSMGSLTRIGQAHPDKLPKGEYGLLEPCAIRERFAKVPLVLKQTDHFAKTCDFDFCYGRLFLPNPLIGTEEKAAIRQAGHIAQDHQLRWRCLRGMVERYGTSYPWRNKPCREELLARIRRELSIVSETGYAGYFLIFGNVVDECARRNIPVLARGSAAGSLICYALGVANVCPFRFGLSFERFLNRERMRHSKLPDIDLDLPWDRREEIISWLYERYGLDKVAMIGGFAHFKGRASVAEVAKAMGIPAHEAHAWSKRLPHGSLRKFIRTRDDYVEAGDVWEDDRFQKALEQAVDLHGLPRHPMMHPCGMVIADRSLMEFTPVGGSARGFSMTQMSMEPIEDLGLLKMDLLGQAGLSVLRDCQDNLRLEAMAGRLAVTDGPDPADPFRNICYTEKRIFKVVRKGDTRGVFHIESPAMTSLLKLCRCADVDCLVATVSVIRPGAANEDKKTKFARRYLGLEAPVYIHPVLEEVLKDTYGLMVYEEHILLVANRFAGMDLGTADLLRRILIKKSDGEAMDELEAVFFACARRHGRSEKEIVTVWSELRDFSGYMFNKAHGAAYAIEAFQGCWLKYYWPVAFLTAVLNNRRGFYAAIVYVMEILRHGGTFSLPDVQWNNKSYRVEDGVVGIPLWQIKGLSGRFLENWERARGQGRFQSWLDFVQRTRLDPADAELLARVGALRSFFDNRHEAVWQAGRISNRSRRLRAFPGTGDLFESSANEERVDLRPMGPVDMADYEAELLGYPVTVNPVELWTRGLERMGTVPISTLREHVDREVEISGIQVCHRLHRTVKGEMMKFVSLADESGIAETVLFPEEYRRYGWAMSQCKAARLRVEVEWDETESGLSLTVVEAMMNEAERN